MNIPCHDDFCTGCRIDEEIAVFIDIPCHAGKSPVHGTDGHFLPQHARQGPPFGQYLAEPLAADRIVEPFDFGQTRRVVVDLQQMKDTDGNRVDPSHLYIVGFWSTGGKPIVISSMKLE